MKNIRFLIYYGKNLGWLLAVSLAASIIIGAYPSALAFIFTGITCRMRLDMQSGLISSMHGSVNGSVHGSGPKDSGAGRQAVTFLRDLAILEEMLMRILENKTLSFIRTCTY